jgi:hypothetical protein
MLSFNDEDEEKNSYKNYFNSDNGSFIIIRIDTIFNGFDELENDDKQ